MNRNLLNLFKILSVFLLLCFSLHKAQAEEETDSIVQQLEILQKDIKTLEKAVYNQDVTSTTSAVIKDDNDVLTKHLLKLSDLEEQFTNLTNKFEEINFKLDKLSNRITKVQTDNQMRFQDLESGTISGTSNINEKEKNYQEVQNLKI